MVDRQLDLNSAPPGRGLVQVHPSVPYRGEVQRALPHACRKVQVQEAASDFSRSWLAPPSWRVSQESHSHIKPTPLSGHPCRPSLRSVLLMYLSHCMCQLANPEVICTQRCHHYYIVWQSGNNNDRKKKKKHPKPCLPCNRERYTTTQSRIMLSIRIPPDYHITRITVPMGLCVYVSGCVCVHGCVPVCAHSGGYFLARRKGLPIALKILAGTRHPNCWDRCQGARARPHTD